MRVSLLDPYIVGEVTPSRNFIDRERWMKAQFSAMLPVLRMDFLQKDIYGLQANP